MKSMVCGFVFDPAGQYVVLMEKKHPEWQAGKYNGIGGKLEPGESPQQAMQRECKEEIGLDLQWWEEIVTLRGDDWEVTFFYTHTDQAHFARQQEDERVGIFSVYSLPETVIYNLRWLIPLALDQDIRKPLGLRGLFDDSQPGWRDRKTAATED